MSGDVPDAVADLLRAANDNDVDAFLATFPQDGVVDDWGREFVGLDAIRAWSDREFIGQRVSLDVSAIERSGDTTVVTAEVGGDGFTGQSHFSFVVDGGLVARMSIRA